MGDDLVQHSELIDDKQDMTKYDNNLPVALAEHHAQVDVLEIQNTDSEVGAENTGEEDEVPLDIFKHEDDTNHVETNQQQLDNNPVQGLPLDLKIPLF